MFAASYPLCFFECVLRTIELSLSAVQIIYNDTDKMIKNDYND